MIETLTPEQEALIPVYREKWGKIELSTKPIDRQQAEIAVKNFYGAIGKKEPSVWIFTSPAAAKQELLSRSPRKLATELGYSLLDIPFTSGLYEEITRQLDSQLIADLHQKLQIGLEQNLQFQQFQLIGIILQQLHNELSQQELEYLEQFWQQLSSWESFWEQQQDWMRGELLKLPGGDLVLQVGDSFWDNVGKPIAEEIEKQPLIREWEEQWREFLLPVLQAGKGLELMSRFASFSMQIYSASLIDFCVDVLNCQVDERKWSALKYLIKNCSWIAPFEKTCLVFDRPTKLFFDSENRFHREGEAAIQFADGYGIYVYQGVRLPAKYGAVHPNLWKSTWLLEEQNAELKRVLIQGIGYDRICTELQAIELDSWREYTLLIIDNDVDVEPIYLLKMTCPSTGYIHALRVPPTMRSAREAISWANWGVDPEEFSTET